ncbi:hypothetical protein AQUCO_04100121v1 [Aquilegia coerulea]|uniref:Uncharacterized protein n=1 Tax=Aquilegia coerulea TaxID=218851 RepID=A0A2G5CRI6_AQUCA|nr:hypothetical protein AQUCO_04100121v1 [Aquilegia coerulea]
MEAGGLGRLGLTSARLRLSSVIYFFKKKRVTIREAYIEKVTNRSWKQITNQYRVGIVKKAKFKRNSYSIKFGYPWALAVPLHLLVFLKPIRILYCRESFYKNKS